LLAVSIPSLVAFDLLTIIVRVNQSRPTSWSHGLAAILGFVPSLAGMAALLWHFCAVASVLFVVLVVSWCITIEVVTSVGYDPKAKI
jgi:hypothetical protein